MNKDKLGTCITYLFTFFLAFFIFAITMLTCVRFTVMSQNYFLKSMDQVQYYSNTATELNRLIKQQARGAGFEADVFAKFVKEEDIRENMVTYEKKMLNGEQATIDTTAFQQKMKDTIDSYTQEKKIKVDNNVQSALDQFVSKSTEKFSYVTQFPYIDQYGSVIRMFSKVYFIAIPILLVASALLFVLLYRLQARRHRRKKYFAISLLGAGLLTATAPAVLYATRFFERIALNPEYVYDLLVRLTRVFLVASMVIGIVYIIVGMFVAYFRAGRRVSTGKDERVYHSHRLTRED